MLHPDWMHAVFWRVKAKIVLFAVIAVAVGASGRPAHERWFDALLLSFVAALTVFALFLGWPPRAKARRDGDGFLMRFTPGWRYGLRGLLLAVCGTFVAISVMIAKQPVAMRITLLAAAPILLVMAIVVARESFRVTSAGVERISPWTGRTTRLRWQDTTHVTPRGARVFVMRGPAVAIKVLLGLEGSSDFAAQALASLPEPVLDAAAGARPLLEVIAARARGGAPGDGERAPLRVRPAPALMVTAVLVAVGVTLWLLSPRLEPEPGFPIPAGWLDLSPTAPERNLRDLPPELRADAERRDFFAFAVEPPRAGRWDQAMSVRLVNGDLDLVRAERDLGPALEKPFPKAHLASHAIEPVGGVRAVRVELSSTEATIIAYALPLGRRFAIALFVCAPSEYPRVSRIAAESVRAMRGLAEPRSLARYAGPLVLSSGTVAILVAMFLGLTVTEASLRRRGLARTDAAASTAPRAPVAAATAVPGAGRPVALIVWVMLLGGAMFFLGVASFVRHRLQPGRPMPAVTAILAVLSVLALLASFLMPRFLPTKQGATAESGALSRHIAVLGAGEASALAAGYAFMRGAAPWTLALAAAGLAAMLAAFPSQRRWSSLRGDRPSLPPDGGG